MGLIGYLHIRDVDAFRYPIHKIGNTFSIDYKNQSILINLPEKYKNKSDLDITLSMQHNYNDYEKEIKDSDFPIYIYIQNNKNIEKIKNNNYIPTNIFTRV
jgi:hypothetical protein